MNEFFDLFLDFSQDPLTEICVHCWVETDEFLVCEKCGVTKSFFAPPSPPDLSEYCKTNSVYSRNTHFRCWLSQLQGKDNYCIPDTLWESLKTISCPTVQEVRKVLKSCKASKLYKAVPFIICKLTNTPLPRFTYQQVLLLEHYFQQVSHSYEKFKKPKSKNLIRYAYVLYKLCEMLGFHQFLNYLSLPKLKTKIAENEKIWERICKERGWTFQPLSSTNSPGSGASSSRQTPH